MNIGRVFPFLGIIRNLNKLNAKLVQGGLYRLVTAPIAVCALYGNSPFVNKPLKNKL